MNKNTIRGLLYVMFAAIFLFVILSCTKKQPSPLLVVEADPPKETITDLNTIGKMDTIANALGCLFAPQSCNKD